MTREIQKKKISDEYIAALSDYAHSARVAREGIRDERQRVKQGKRRRKQERDEATLSPDAMEEMEARLSAQSIRESYGLKDLTRALRHREQLAKEKVAALEKEINDLIEERSRQSNALQQRIFEHYAFLDAEGNERGLGSIFADTIFGIPPAGAGECAAPKLLQYAYQNQLKPIALAEFWWGQSPASEIRQHGNFYPACRGKCEPILGHMLSGLAVDPNPMLMNPAAGKTLTTVYEDDHLLVVNKPHEFLSVPGKTIEDSVWLRIKKRYPEATGPLIVHRLDMSTSGLMLLTKTKDVHKQLQRQFFKRSIRKRYVALLHGLLEGEEGTIDLPLRGDLEDRPRQIVCHEHGKSSRSHWKVVSRAKTTTLVHLFPVTGRTHQLRVHAAHPDGLGLAIVGDDLYGKPADRLHLHAESITFMHPVSREEMTFTVEERFGL